MTQSRTRYKNSFFKKEAREDDPYIKITVAIPRSMFQKLSVESAKNKLPIARLVAFVLDNELQKESPFEYDLGFPENIPYVENQYAEDAERLRDFLKRLPTGTGIDSLVLFREDIGFKFKRTVHLAYRELKKANQIREFYPNVSFIYEPGYRYIKLNDQPFGKSEKTFTPLQSNKGPLNEVD